MNTSLTNYIYIGSFNETDLKEGKDKRALKRAKELYDYKDIQCRIVYVGSEKKLAIYIK